MGLIIGLGSYLGFKLDNYFKLDNLFTICSSLAGIFGALFYVIREVKNSLIVQKIIYSLRVLVFATVLATLHFNFLINTI